VSERVFDAIRNATARVVERAHFVRIDAARLESLALELARMPPADPGFDPGHHRVGDDATALAFVFTLNAVNFGSGYFPYLAKRPGLSGYLTIATNLEDHFVREGPWSAQRLLALDASDCARVLGQDLAAGEVAELMALFATAWNDLGEFLVARHAGAFEGVVAAAEKSAAKLVVELARMPFYRDVARYEDFDVPFYKRAQITAADLAVAFESRGLGAFDDFAELTIFADNLVPHVLRRRGVLVYADDLARRIDAAEPIDWNSAEEVEIRASALVAVERMVAQLADAGVETTAQRVDYQLWTHGQRPEIKATPRHRTRSTYY
jgi:hypothetical protein